MKKIVITGGEGLIGKKLQKYFNNKYDVISLDISLGHDLTDEKFVNNFFTVKKHVKGWANRFWFKWNTRLYECKCY